MPVQPLYGYWAPKKIKKIMKSMEGRRTWNGKHMESSAIKT
jgi:hypothetical protein